MLTIVRLGQYSLGFADSYLLESAAGDRGALCCAADIEAFSSSIAQKQHACTNDCPGTNMDVITQCCVDSDEALFVDRHAAGNDYMRGKEAMISDDGMVTNMVAAPQGDIVADLHERLNGVVFKNKAILAYHAVVQ